MAAPQAPDATLPPRVQAFLEAFILTGNATKAAIAAGYSSKTAKQQGSRLLLTNVDLQRALAKRLQARTDQAIADADERDRLLTECARDTKAEWKDRRAAIVELNRCSGRHSVQVNVHGKLTLEDALEAANKRLEERRAKQAKK